MSSGGGSESMLEHQNEQIKLKFDHDLKSHEQLWGMKIKRDENGKILEPQEFEQQWVTDEATGVKKKAGVSWDAFDNQMKSWQAQVDNEIAGRQYQEGIQQEQWELGVDQQQFQWSQQDAAYKKNQDIVTEQLALNDAEYNFAAEEEASLLQEQLIEGAYTNLELNNEFYQSVGAKGFEEIALKHGLKKTESDIEYQGDKIATAASHKTGQLDTQVAKTKLGNIGKKADHAFAQGQVVGQLQDSQIANTYKLASLAVERNIGEQRTDAQEMKIKRHQDGVRAKAAHENQERVIQSLKAQGQASLTQAGRSKGKAQQAIMAEIGRHNTYVANSMVRGEAAAKAEIAMSRKQQINNVHKSHLASMKINEDNMSAISSAKRAIAKADSTLAIGQQRDELDVNSIQKEIDNLILSSTVDLDRLEATFEHAQGEAGIALNKNDWDISNIEKNFALSQDQLGTSLEQAVEASMRNQEGLVLDKDRADAKAMAMSMLDPNAIADPETGETWRDKLSLENYQPDPLPVPNHVTPLEPTAPIDPVEGSMIDTSAGGMGTAMGVAGGVATGLGMAAGFQSLGAYGTATAGAWTGAAGAFATAAPWVIGGYMVLDAFFDF